MVRVVARALMPDSVYFKAVFVDGGVFLALTRYFSDTNAATIRY